MGSATPSLLDSCKCRIRSGCVYTTQTYVETEQNDHEGNTWFMLAPWQVELVKMVPTRWMSRTWGSMCNLYIPELLRKPLFDTYGWWFNCKLEEAVVSDVTTYNTFNEYFLRKLKPGARCIDSAATLVSPADA